MLKKFLLAVVAVTAAVLAPAAHGQTQAQADAMFDLAWAKRQDALAFKTVTDWKITDFDCNMTLLQQERDSWAYMGANWITINEFMIQYGIDNGEILSGPPGFDNSYQDGEQCLDDGIEALTEGAIRYGMGDYPGAHAWRLGALALFSAAESIFSSFPDALETSNQGAEYFLSIW